MYNNYKKDLYTQFIIINNMLLNLYFLREKGKYIWSLLHLKIRDENLTILYSNVKKYQLNSTKNGGVVFVKMVLCQDLAPFLFKLISPS